MFRGGAFSRFHIDLRDVHEGGEIKDGLNNIIFA